MTPLFWGILGLFAFFTIVTIGSLYLTVSGISSELNNAQCVRIGQFESSSLEKMNEKIVANIFEPKD